MKYLQNFADTLRKFADGPLDVSPGREAVPVRLLYDAGLLAGIDTSDLDDDSFDAISLTPDGAVALAEWDSLLRRESWRGKLLAVADRLVWLLVGAGVTAAGSLLGG